MKLPWPFQKGDRSPAADSLQRHKLLLFSKAAYVLAAIWALSGAIATGIDLSWVRYVEQRFQGNFFVIRGTVPPPDDIVILSMDDYTFSQLDFYLNSPEEWPDFVEWLASNPWQRVAHATVLERLMQAEAQGIAVDVIFAGPSVYGPEDDASLIEVLQTYSASIALAAEYLEDNTDQGQSIDLLEPVTNAQGDTTVAIGYVNALPAVDGRISQLPSSYRELVLTPLGLPELPSFSEVALDVAQFDYATPEGGNIFFYGPPRTFKHIPFWSVLEPESWQQHLKNETFKGKLVLVGPTAASFQDQHPVAFSDQMAGIEVHANAVATLLEGRSIRQALPNPMLRGFFVLAIVGAAVVLIQLPKQALRQFAVGIGAILIWGGISYASFTYGYLILPVAIPIGAIALSTISFMVTEAATEQLEKLRLRRTLERYVAAPVVQEILQQPEDYQSLMKGRKIKAAVLFSDIRGFTTFSEEMAAQDRTEELVQQLNTYLDGMVRAIVDEGGTIDKFIGDAVMAEFGSPVSRGEKEDAMNAIHAALSMRRTLNQLRSQWQDEGCLPFFNGIGINYGELIAGNIGSLSRLEYTVIGDTVNVASRVEGMTKQFGVDILITGALYDLVKDDVEAQFVGAHQLKGHTKVPLYSLVGLKGDNPDDYLRVRNQLRQHIGWKPATILPGSTKLG